MNIPQIGCKDGYDNVAALDANPKSPATTESVMLLTCASATHVPMLVEYLLPSVRGNVEVVFQPLDQDSPTGVYDSQGFSRTVENKMAFIAGNASKNIGRLCVFADADVQFFTENLAASAQLALGDREIAFQNDGGGGFCTGLIVFRATSRVCGFLSTVAQITPQFQHDQEALNHVLGADSEWETFRELLPARWWTHGIERSELWDGNAPVAAPPTDLVAHHANWTIGLRNKHTLLEIIRNAMSARDASEVTCSGLDDYQEQLFLDFENFRPAWPCVAYPPYHRGLNMEEHFIREFRRRGSQTRQYFLPVLWSSCIKKNNFEGLQDALSQLDPSKEYFCVSHHDDAVRETLPPKTLRFHAGGNADGIPIPLVCSRINYRPLPKTILCSFVGSTTHRIRHEMVRQLEGKAGFEIHHKPWQMDVSVVSTDLFLRKTAESVFSLCPRGYCPASFRFYEALQLGAVPVYIYDKPWFPYANLVDWDSFCIRVHESCIGDIPKLLTAKAGDALKMVAAGRDAYEKFFSLDVFADPIFSMLDR